MSGVLVRFAATFIPICVIAAAGLWLALEKTGFWRPVGWVIAAVFGLVALLQAYIFVTGLAHVASIQKRAAENLEVLQERDAELLAQGKSFDEVMAQYKRKQ